MFPNDHLAEALNDGVFALFYLIKESHKSQRCIRLQKRATSVHEHLQQHEEICRRHRDDSRLRYPSVTKSCVMPAGTTGGQRVRLAASAQTTSRFNCRADGCCDQHEFCSFWAGVGECRTNAPWMPNNCRISCNTCRSTPAAAAAVTRAPGTSTSPVHVQRLCCVPCVLDVRWLAQ